MKSTLPIRLFTGPMLGGHVVEVPCCLPEAFNFKFAGWLFTALVSGGVLSDVDSESSDSISIGTFAKARTHAESILATIKAALGLTGPVPPGSPLPAIALAYEAEVAAHEAQCKVLRELPRSIKSPSDVPAHPSDDVSIGFASPAARMLSKYVEHVVEQAAKEAP